MAETDAYRRFRAPQEDGQSLVEPPRATLGDVVKRNREQLSAIEYDVQGRTLADLSAKARRSLVVRAWNYTREYRDVSDRHRAAAANNSPLILSGHQPQLFHAGVWYKNFVLGSLAAEVDGAAIHLLIDSDLCRSASIRVPAGTVSAPRLETVAFDLAGEDTPYEERGVYDEAVFGAFAGEVRRGLQSLVADPLVMPLWSLLPPAQSPSTLGLRIAQARHRLEETFGNDTLELPQSSVCQLPEFHWFVAHLLAHLPRFQAAYNGSLAAYRRAHHLRNRAQPVPDLAEIEGWLEAPFWMWSADDPRRRPVFARQRDDVIELTDRHCQTIALTLSADSDAALAAAELAAAAERGVKLRTRALATTLFARLVLGDLFLHGIGGAKYDQVTDDISRRFCGFELPQYATASATLRLPIAHGANEHDSLSAIKGQLRELQYHPERFVAGNGAAAPAAAAIGDKLRTLQITKTPANARERHEAISSANAALQPYVESRRSALREQREQIERRQSVDAILNSREYSFCLFPREHFAQLLSQA
ncbi:MAG: hypothetical protein AB7G28_01045 [Pirellulales bacterium]